MTDAYSGGGVQVEQVEQEEQWKRFIGLNLQVCKLAHFIFSDIVR